MSDICQGEQPGFRALDIYTNMVNGDVDERKELIAIILTAGCDGIIKVALHAGDGTGSDLRVSSYPSLHGLWLR